MSSLPEGNAPLCDDFSCTADLSRCTSGNQVYLFRRAERGLYLYATLAYVDRAADRESGAMALVLSRRDRVCELFEMIHAREPRIGPRGYRGLHGDQARQTAVADASALDDGVHFECTQSGCIMNLASNGADLLGQIVAYREPDGTLFVLDRVMMEEQSEN